MTRPAVRDRWRMFQRRRGLVVDGIPGHKTLDEVEFLEGELVTAEVPIASIGSSIPWYHAALGELGVREKVGVDHDTRVLEYLQECHRDRGGTLGDWGASRDETPWCAAFVAWCLHRAGLPSTRSAAARSYLGYGQEIDQPVKGAIVVLERGTGWSGHVGFVDRVDRGWIHVLGGNQGNAVSVRKYAASRLLGYRWPPETSTV